MTRMTGVWMAGVLAVVPRGARAQELWSGILDSTRAIDWTQAGIPGGIPDRTTICATISASTYGSGSSDATTGIQNALNGCASGEVVSLGAGTFLIDGSLSVPSNVTLRGAGANQTILNAMTSANAVINLGTGQPNTAEAVSITGGATQGSTTFTVSDASNLAVGSYLLVNELNDPSFVNSNGSEGACTWCDLWNGTRSLGQTVEVEAVNGTTVTISPALYWSYTLTPLATPFEASAKYAGVEDLQVYANNQGFGQVYSMSACAYCWIKGVEDNYTDGNHVTTAWAYRGEIVDSYFSNAYLHTPGTYDSDVDLTESSSEMLVQNNILERNHVSIMLEWGASGNVIAYNYSLGDFDTNATNAMLSGLNTHGAHPFMNLFEGNVTYAFNLDSIWGSHSDNTLFRNWITGANKVCNPTSGRGAVSCAGADGWWAIQQVQALTIDFLGSSYNTVGNVIGSAEMAALTFYNDGTTPLQQVNDVVAVCGPMPCGPGSRSYDAAAYGYSLGFGEASDDGSSGFDSLIPYSTIFTHGDYSNITGATAWTSGVTQTLPPSFYLSAAPAWFGSVPFPAIGPDVVGGVGPAGHAYANPAQHCYETVMGGTDGTGSPLAFNAASCYGIVGSGGTVGTVGATATSTSSGTSGGASGANTTSTTGHGAGSDSTTSGASGTTGRSHSASSSSTATGSTATGSTATGSSGSVSSTGGFTSTSSSGQVTTGATGQNETGCSSATGQDSGGFAVLGLATLALRRRRARAG